MVENGSTSPRFAESDKVFFISFDRNRPFLGITTLIPGICAVSSMTW
jgi:hypothetical protein